jgi:hypothetical protein
MIWGGITKKQKQFIRALRHEIVDMDSSFDLEFETDKLFSKTVDNLSDEEATELIEYLIEERQYKMESLEGE